MSCAATYGHIILNIINMQLNKQVFLFLNGLADKNSVLDAIWVFFAQYAIFIFGLVLIYFLYRDKKIFFRVTASAMFTVILVALIKKIWPFPRPFLQEGARLLITYLPDSTFPSNHTAVAFTLAMGVFFKKKRLGIWLLILASLIGLSRIIVGVHYPLDILAGILIGCVIAYSSHKFIFS